MFPTSFLAANEAKRLLNALVGKPAAASAAPAAAQWPIETDSEDEDINEQPRQTAQKKCRSKNIGDDSDSDGDDDTDNEKDSDDQGAAPPMAVKSDKSAAAARSAPLPDLDFDMSDEEGAIMRAGPAAADAPVAVDSDIQRQFNLLDDAMTEPHKFEVWYGMHLLDGNIDEDILPVYIKHLQSRGVCTKGIDHLV